MMGSYGRNSWSQLLTLTGRQPPAKIEFFPNCVSCPCPSDKPLGSSTQDKRDICSRSRYRLCPLFEANSDTRLCVQSSMQIEAHIKAETVKRLEEQSKLLVRTYQAELAKDPTSRATKSSRSNLIALSHTIKQIYGEATSLAIANPLVLAADAAS